MERNKTVICFEGINNRVWEILGLFTEDMLVEMEFYSNQARDILGIDCYRKLVLGKTDNEIENAYTELVGTYISNYVIFKYFIKYGIKPDLLIGFSLGLNTAMASSGYISFKDGLDILVVNRHCMEYFYEHGNYGMAFIVGLSLKVVQSIIEEKGMIGKVKIASETSEYSILITGEKYGIDVIEKRILEEGAMHFNRINSYIPFHYNLHNDFVDQKLNKIDDIKVKNGCYKVFSIYSLEMVEEKDIHDELKKNIYSPMNWRRTISELEDMGYKDFWDVSITASNKKMSLLKEKDSTFYTFKHFKTKYFIS